MRNATKVRKVVPTPFTDGRDSALAPDEPSAPDESCTSGQLIDMADWRLLPPVDPGLDGAA
jgi:hypothetical protein